MENFEFKSAICTSVEQSKRLLELGLKKETADMYITDMSKKGINYTDDWQIGSIPYCDVMSFWDSKGLQLEKTAWSIIPAWSLHRLVEMIPLDIWHTEYENGPRLKHTFWFCKHAPSYISVENIDFRAHPNLYDNIIDCIEWLINEDYFNKDYLEEEK